MEANQQLARTQRETVLARIEKLKARKRKKLLKKQRATQSADPLSAFDFPVSGSLDDVEIEDIDLDIDPEVILGVEDLVEQIGEFKSSLDQYR